MTTQAIRPTAPSWALPLLAGVLALLWLMVFAQLSLEWRVNALYAYGWAIPPLALYLLRERWLDRPSPETPHQVRWTLLVGLAALVLFFPLRLIQEANPDWILLNWFFTAAAVTVTLAVIYATGGAAWLRWLAFPVCFVVTAVAWPARMENLLLQNLALTQAFLSAETVNLVGYTAVQNGATITVNGNEVLVDEACSGIKSVQTAFMMSLFFGEFFRLGGFARFMLVFSSFAVAFLFNFLRTLTLTIVGGNEGTEGIDRWHDPLGMVVMVACLVSLWLLARWFHNAQSGTTDPPESGAPSLPESQPKPERERTLALDAIVPGGAERAGPSARDVKDGGFQRFRRIPVALILFAGGWLALVEGSTQAWYAWNESGAPSVKPWSVAFPSDAPFYAEGEFSEAEARILKYSSGTKAAWLNREQVFFDAYYLRWEPGRVSKSLAWAHSPTICLPAVGLEQQSVAETPVVVEVDGVTLTLQGYLFEDTQGRPVYVFHGIQEDRALNPEGNAGLSELTWQRRLDAVFNGWRNQGQRKLGISVRGPLSYEAAESALRRELPRVVMVGKGKA
ncbi:MAG: exosortase/archaeosortase family protein [Opitutales bacterium]